MTTEPQNPPAILKKVDTIEKLEAFLKKKRKVQKIIQTMIYFLDTL